MRLATGTSDTDVGRWMGHWAALRIPHLDLEALGPFSAIGAIDQAGRPAAVALYHGYAPLYGGIEISFALERHLTRGVIAGIMTYPFDQLRVERITAATPTKSASTRRFLEHFGFKREGLIRKGFGTFGDAVVYGLLRKDWEQSPFYPRSRLDGQEKLPGSAARA